jgi:hypothetical protein
VSSHGVFLLLTHPTFALWLRQHTRESSANK